MTHKRSGINIERTTLIKRLKQQTLEREEQQTNNSIREINNTLTEWDYYKRRSQLES